VTLEQLQLFRDIAQHRSVSRGADLNGISQSAASQHLQEAEKQLDMQLVDRSTRPLTVTPAGRMYFDFCREVLRLRQEFEVNLESLKGSVEGVCRVASIYSIGLSEMSSLESEFSRRFPSAELKVEYLRPEKVYQAVLADSADVGLVSYPEPKRELKVTPWREEKMMVVTAPSHRLAARDSLGARDLQGEDFIAFDDDLPVSREIRRYLKESGVEVRQVQHFDNIHSMKEAVALGSGVSILPEPILRTDIQQGRLCAIPLDAALSRPIGILQQRRKRLNRATQSFLHLLGATAA